MSILDNKTEELWRSFSPKIPQIKHKVSDDRISLQIYPSDYFKEFNPAIVFTKWALVEVDNPQELPSELEVFELDAGLYAVFDYKGPSNDPSIFQYIYSEWLPQSEYELDDKPHFEVLGATYKNNSPDSEEEIWVPVREGN